MYIPIAAVALFVTLPIFSLAQDSLYIEINSDSANMEIEGVGPNRSRLLFVNTETNVFRLVETELEKDKVAEKLRWGPGIGEFKAFATKIIDSHETTLVGKCHLVGLASESAIRSKPFQFTLTSRLENNESVGGMAQLNDVKLICVEDA